MTKEIKNYNNAIIDLVTSFYGRYLTEIDAIEDYDLAYDVHIMDYNGVYQGPVEIFDYYFSVDDIAICEANKIPIKVFTDYYRFCMEKDGKPGINLYNYWQKNKDPEEYERKEKEELEDAEKNTAKAKRLLEEIIKLNKK